MKTKIFSIMAVILIAASCKKYPEGPGLTILTKKHRISHDWNVTNALIDNQTINFSSFKWSIAKNGQFNISAIAPDGSSVIASGTWEFTQNNMYVKFTYSTCVESGQETYTSLFTFSQGSSNRVEEYRIMELKNSEMHLNGMVDGNTIDLKFKTN